MKNLRKLVLGVVALATLALTTGCYGSFQLTGKIYQWNGKATDNKWANSIIMFGLTIIPVYPFCLFIDYVILNAVEFWTGSNPLAMNEGESETQVIASGDKVYEVTATQNQFHIEQTEGVDAGKAVDLVYQPEEAAWYVTDGDETVKLAQGDLNNNAWVKVFHPDGKVEEVAMK